VSRNNVLAGTALFVALSGGAYAATIAGFVGSTGRIQGCVKSNGTLTVVKTGKKCAKHTTSLVFNAKGTAGARGANGSGGAPGAKGASGAPGAQGVTGPAGSAGAANGFSTQDSPTALIVLAGVGIPTPVASVALPAGNFVVQADVQVENSGANNVVSCVLAGGCLLPARPTQRWPERYPGTPASRSACPLGLGTQSARRCTTLDLLICVDAHSLHPASSRQTHDPVLVGRRGALLPPRRHQIPQRRVDAPSAQPTGNVQRDRAPTDPRMATAAASRLARVDLWLAIASRARSCWFSRLSVVFSRRAAARSRTMCASSGASRCTRVASWSFSANRRACMSSAHRPAATVPDVDGIV